MLHENQKGHSVESMESFQSAQHLGSHTQRAQKGHSMESFQNAQHLGGHIQRAQKVLQDLALYIPSSVPFAICFIVAQEIQFLLAN